VLCGRAGGGRATRPRAPGCRPRRGSGFSRGSKIYAQGVYFWVYMEVLKGISPFERPTTACLRGCRCSGPGRLRQRTTAPPRPGHSLWRYMQPAPASTSVEVAHTSGGCDSRRRGPGSRRNRPPRLALALESRQPLWALGPPHWGACGSFTPPPPPTRGLGGEPAAGIARGRRPRCRNGDQSLCLGSGSPPLLILQIAQLVRALAPRDGTCEVRSTAWGH
jgi:hypothetical protein